MALFSNGDDYISPDSSANVRVDEGDGFGWSSQGQSSPAYSAFEARADQDGGQGPSPSVDAGPASPHARNGQTAGGIMALTVFSQICDYLFVLVLVAYDAMIVLFQVTEQDASEEPIVLLWIVILVMEVPLAFVLLHCARTMHRMRSWLRAGMGIGIPARDILSQDSEDAVGTVVDAVRPMGQWGHDVFLKVRYTDYSGRTHESWGPSAVTGQGIPGIGASVRVYCHKASGDGGVCIFSVAPDSDDGSRGSNGSRTFGSTLAASPWALSYRDMCTLEYPQPFVVQPAVYSKSVIVGSLPFLFIGVFYVFLAMGTRFESDGAPPSWLSSWWFVLSLVVVALGLLTSILLTIPFSRRINEWERRCAQARKHPSAALPGTYSGVVHDIVPVPVFQTGAFLGYGFLARVAVTVDGKLWEYWACCDPASEYGVSASAGASLPISSGTTVAVRFVDVPVGGLHPVAVFDPGRRA